MRSVIGLIGFNLSIYMVKPAVEKLGFKQTD